MKRLLYYLRYDWPLHFVMLLTSWLPNNAIFFRIRGLLSRPFLGSCGENLSLGRNVTFYNASNINLGTDVYIAIGCVFLANDEITIEDEVIMGPYCVLASGNHTTKNKSFRFGGIALGPITIKKGCWLGTHVVISAGNCVDTGSLIAAGSVVTSNIPKYSLAGGVPARVIKNINTKDTSVKEG